MEWNVCMYFHILYFLSRYMHMDLHMQIWIHTYILPAHIGRDAYVHYIYTVCTVCICVYIYILYYHILYYITLYTCIYLYILISDDLTVSPRFLSHSPVNWVQFTGGSTIPTKTACSTDLEASSSTHCVAFKTSRSTSGHGAQHGADGWDHISDLNLYSFHIYIYTIIYNHTYNYMYNYIYNCIYI